MVRAALRATEGQMVASLNREASLLSEIQQLKLQQAASATGKLRNPSNTGRGGPHPDAPAKAKPHTAKTKPGLREPGNV